jgi:hypothetical protein
MHDRMPATNEVGRGRPTRLIAALIRLFPAPWRDRYGDEFAALLEGTPLDARALFDVCSSPPSTPVSTRRDHDGGGR